MMSSGYRTLHHGTTRNRAEQLLVSPPELDYREPGSGRRRTDRWGGFSTSLAGSPDIGLQTPADYARQKAGVFPTEGGPVILEIEVPAELVDRLLSDRLSRWMADSSEVRFDADSGLDDLRRVWLSLTKRILPL